jgi:hypothetical protein
VNHKALFISFLFIRYESFACKKWKALLSNLWVSLIWEGELIVACRFSAQNHDKQKSEVLLCFFFFEGHQKIEMAYS